MAKKTKKKTKQSQKKSTDWNLGQPLAFPLKRTLPKIDRIAGEAVEEFMRGTFKPTRQKPKKK